MNREAIATLIFTDYVWKMYKKGLNKRELCLKLYNMLIEQIIIPDTNININNKENDCNDSNSIVESVKILETKYLERFGTILRECSNVLMKIPLDPRLRICVTIPNNYLRNNNDNNGNNSKMMKSVLPESLKWDTVEFPRNFSWIVPKYVCGVSIPKRKDQIKAFNFLNIGLIVTLMEDPLPRDLFDFIEMNRYNRGRSSKDNSGAGTTESDSSLMIRDIHVACGNYKAPRIEDLNNAMNEAAKMIFLNNKGVIFHCGGGKGRAGTGLACFIIKYGINFDLYNEYVCIKKEIPIFSKPQLSATQAIKHIRFIRPGSIETKEQENFIKEYANTLWTKAYTNDDNNDNNGNNNENKDENKNDENETKSNKKKNNNNEEKSISIMDDVLKDPTGLTIYPQLSKQQINILKSKDYCELIILCGIPGSGKSLFCSMLNSLNKQQLSQSSQSQSQSQSKSNKKMKIIHEWWFANQDKAGKASDIEYICKKWMISKQGKKLGLVIDRCNVLKKDRMHWIDLTFKIKKVWCVWLDFSLNICQERIAKRKNHPTIQFSE